MASIKCSHLGVADTGARNTKRKNKSSNTQNDDASAQEGLLLGLGVSDLVDHKANTALGDDVGDAVADLDGDNRLGSGDAQHWEQVDNWVGAPRDHSHHLGSGDLAGNSLVLLSSSGGSQADQELVDDVQEEGHGDEPAHPARSQVTSHDQLTIVARHNHQGSTQAQAPSLGAELRSWQLHHQQDLDQEQRHSQEPVHVSVGIVEWHTSQLWRTHLQGTSLHRASSVLVGINPRVEDSDVVVGSDEGHQARDDHSRLVPVLHSEGAEPQVHGGGHHARQGEGEHVVHRLVLQIGHRVHHHGCKNLWLFVNDQTSK